MTKSAPKKSKKSRYQPRANKKPAARVPGTPKPRPRKRPAVKVPVTEPEPTPDGAVPVPAVPV